MLILSVDTSTRMGSAAILRDYEVVAEASGIDANPYSTRIFRDVATLQAQAKFSLNQVDLFAVGTGPGSFTGLRVGLTAVKAWAEVHGKPIAPVSVLEAIAAEFLLGTDPASSRPGVARTSRTRDGSCAGLVAPFLDARRGQVFGAVYRLAVPVEGAVSLCGEEYIVSPIEFLELVERECSGEAILVSPTPEALQVSLGMEKLKGRRIEQVAGALAVAIGRLGLDRAKRGQVVDAMRLDANYVRRSDAEAAWRDRG